MTPSSGQKGMLSTQAGRKTFFATLVDLYKSDLAFRGMTDFAVIGAVVMIFLHPPHLVQWPWGGSGHGSGGLSSAGLDPGGGGGGSPGSAAVAPSGPVAAGPVVAIPYPEALKNPRLGVGFLFDIDAKAFKSSSAADQPRLQASLAGVALRDPGLIIEKLRAADGDDPNVALMRGAAFIIRNTEESNRTGEALWRQAVNGGSVQAKALLGRLLVSARKGIKQDAKEGRRLIEDGAAAGDRQALRFLGIAYLAGDLGVLDPAKAVETLKQAADAGDAMAMAVYSRMIAEGIGVPAPDGKAAERYLRKAAAAGLTLAQVTLGDWLISEYTQGLTADPQEAVDWLTKAYEKGHDVDALNKLAFLYASAAKKPPWKDVARAMAYVRLCSGFSDSFCQYNTGIGWAGGHFGKRNAALARAHFAIADTLGYQPGASQVRQLDAELTATQKDEASAYEKKIRAELEPEPTQIPLQYASVTSPPAPKAISSYIQTVADTSSGKPNEAARTDVSKTADYKLCTDTNGEITARGQACTRIIDAGKGSPLELSEAYFGRGWVEDKQNNNDAAIADYSQAVKLYPAHTAARNNRGLQYISANKLDEAIADFDEILKAEPNHKLALTNKAEALRRKGRNQEALEEVKKALDLDADLKWAQIVQSRILADMKAGMKKEKGEGEAAAGGETFGPDDPPSASSKEVVALRKRALAHLAEKDYDSAIADFTDIIRADNASWMDYDGRARAYHFKQKFDAAIADYGRAIARKGHNALVHYNRALIYRKQGDTDKALADLDAAIDKHDAKDPLYFLTRAELLLDKRAFDKAIKDYDTLVDLVGKDKSATEDNKAFTYYVRGQAKTKKIIYDHQQCDRMIPPTPECKDPRAFMIPLLDLQAAVAIKPDYAQALFQIGWTSEQLGNTQKAIEYYTKAINADPNYSVAYNNRGVLYGDMKQKELALADYNDAIRHDANNYQAWANRGVLYATMRGRNNRRRAIADLRHALQISPNYGFALQALQKMGVRP